MLFVYLNPSDNPPCGVLPAPRPGSLLGGTICQDIRVNAQVGTRSPYSLPFVILPVPARSPFRFIRHRRRSTPNLKEGAFWCGTNSNIKPALKGDSSRARPVGDAARGESGGIGSIASGSAARRPYSNQRCGFRVAKAGGVIKRLIALCLSQPLRQSALRRIASSPAGEPFGWHYMPRYTS